MNLATFEQMFRYGDAMNDRILTAAAGLGLTQLDLPQDMGVGSLRRTLLHILAGESVWLKRWRGETETRWPDEKLPTPVADIQAAMNTLRGERSNFMATLNDAKLASEQTYRDSKGSLFTARLADMLMQGCVHSIHHRAQAVNMIRRLGGGSLEMDYMTWLRRPAT
ncbi:MAG: DinB family protein [Phycisphaerae bacterium]|nr:DinB family protein [Phycisphaerae bacterium]